jgi:outer membrane murein-binding lipoprotein Lpp
MEEKIDLLIKSVNEIKTTQSKLVTSVNSLSEKFASLNKKVIELSSQISSLSSDNASLKERVDIIESKTNSLITNPSTLNNNKLISEMIDRQSRLKNILLFNLPESTFDSNSTNLDRTTVQNILNYLNLESAPTSIFRLGKPPSTSTPTKPRPLKICFSDQKNVFDIFSTQNKLKSNSSWKDLRFSSDRTKQQQEYMSQLRQELLNRKSNGEPNLIIKYIKGTPTITSSKN